MSNRKRDNAAVLDPPESGPPEPDELGESAGDTESKPVFAPAAMSGKKRGRKKKQPQVAEQPTTAGKPPEQPAEPGAFVFSDPIAAALADGMAVQLAPEWPKGPITVDWPWQGEPNPEVGQIVGWNWQTGQVAVVRKQPAIYGTEPWRIEIGLEPMSKAWRHFKSYDLQSGAVVGRLVWYTRWNRAYVEQTKRGDQKSSGWLAVVKDGE